MISVKCELNHLYSQRPVADSISVDSCTNLLPEMKPRYVMGIV
jgi:hypothetical protein